ncbi:Uncharacterised protein [Vibrio cholerae]|nr:Uncharacterised protein [Vibrio cholerae]CSI69227.1 Uncharacterised protein [Vibrio cholerae]
MLSSSGTTSATVPSATKSISSINFGSTMPCAANQPC